MNAPPYDTQPLPIGRFLQDIATLYTELDGFTSRKVFSIACTADGALYAGTADGLAHFDATADRWRRVDACDAVPVRWLRPTSGGDLWIGTLHKVCHLHAMMAWTDKIPRAATVAAAVDPKSGTITGLLTEDRFIDCVAHAEIALPAQAIGRALARRADGTPVVATSGGVFCYTDGELSPLPLPYSTPPGSEGAPSDLPPIDATDLAADAHGGLWIATTNGLSYYTEGRCWNITGESGLPVLALRCLTLSPDGTLWMGTAHGAVRLRHGQWRYYAGRRWLPDDTVNAIALDSEGNAWIATEGGLAHIAWIPMIFAQKAAHYEQITALRHNRDGFVTDCLLTRPGDLTDFTADLTDFTADFVYHASDNDGLWTALYLCAESFRYAVTGEPAARALARKSLRALLELVRVTGIPGFPARALFRRGERTHRSEPAANWLPSPLDPNVLYKQETSSDELDGHYLAWYVYSELVADATERQAIADTCRAVTHHILDHNYTLTGPTGMPTRWGVWTPDRLNADPEWAAERGLNSLEILSHLKVALHLCGDARFATAYRTLITAHHYALNTVRQKMLPPEADNNHSDDELAACAYYPLLRLETDPHLRALYLLSLERTQAILRPEGSPFHNVIYGACTGQPCDAEAAARWLRNAPWDLRHWTMTNSHRADITFAAERGRFQERQLTRPLPPNETCVARWNHNPYNPDGGNDGRSEEDGTFWLLPYWMGRYHGIFCETSPPCRAEPPAPAHRASTVRGTGG